MKHKRQQQQSKQDGKDDKDDDEDVDEELCDESRETSNEDSDNGSKKSIQEETKISNPETDSDELPFTKKTIKAKLKCVNKGKKRKADESKQLKKRVCCKTQEQRRPDEGSSSCGNGSPCETQSPVGTHDNRCSKIDIVKTSPRGFEADDHRSDMNSPLSDDGDLQDVSTLTKSRQNAVTDKERTVYSDLDKDRINFPLKHKNSKTLYQNDVKPNGENSYEPIECEKYVRNEDNGHENMPHVLSQSIAMPKSSTSSVYRSEDQTTSKSSAGKMLDRDIDFNETNGDGVENGNRLPYTKQLSEEYSSSQQYYNYEKTDIPRLNQDANLSMYEVHPMVGASPSSDGSNHADVFTTQHVNPESKKTRLPFNSNSKLNSACVPSAVNYNQVSERQFHHNDSDHQGLPHRGRMPFDRSLSVPAVPFEYQHPSRWIPNGFPGPRSDSDFNRLSGYPMNEDSIDFVRNSPVYPKPCNPHLISNTVAGMRNGFPSHGRQSSLDVPSPFVPGRVTSYGKNSDRWNDAYDNSSKCFPHAFNKTSYPSSNYFSTQLNALEYNRYKAREQCVPSLSRHYSSNGWFPKNNCTPYRVIDSASEYSKSFHSQPRCISPPTPNLSQLTKNCCITASSAVPQPIITLEEENFDDGISHQQGFCPGSVTRVDISATSGLLSSTQKVLEM